MDINLNVNGRITLMLDIAKETFLSMFPKREASTPEIGVTDQPKEDDQVSIAESGSQTNQTATPENPSNPVKNDDAMSLMHDIPSQIVSAMAETRCRIEGEDWMTNTTSEGYKKYHKALNVLFKQEADRLAQCKPTQIADEMSCRQFCEYCKLIKVVNGELTVDRSLDAVLGAVDDDLPF